RTPSPTASSVPRARREQTDGCDTAAVVWQLRSHSAWPSTANGSSVRQRQGRSTTIVAVARAVDAGHRAVTVELQVHLGAFGAKAQPDVTREPDVYAEQRCSANDVCAAVLRSARDLACR